MKKFLLALALIVPMFAFTGCGGDDDEPNVSNQTLNVGQTYTIPSDGTWVSDNDLIATVSGKTVKGVRVGEVAVRNGSQSFNVTVNPTITLFQDPCVQFGATQQVVKDYMSGYELISEEADNLIFTKNRSSDVLYGYSFENTKLNMSMVIAVKSVATVELMGEMLAERYVLVTSKDDYIGMVSPDKKMLVVLMIKVQSGKIVYAISYAPASNSKSDVNDLEAAFEEMINATPGELVKDGMK